MNRQLLCAELAPYNVLDSELLTATRYNGQIYAGVRVGGAAVDRHCWIYGRYGEHKDSTYEGFWAMFDAPPNAGLRALDITGAVRTQTPDAPVWTAPPGALLSLAWDIQPDSWGRPLDNASVEVRVWQAFTGIEPPIAVAAASPKALPSLASGSYCVWARLSLPGVYRGLPPDFEAVSGQKPDDKTLLWKDARTGRIYAFSPRFAVGALPPRGHELREQFENLLASGGVTKHAPWVSWLFELDADGAAFTTSSEWAMVRLVVEDADGAGEWIGERNVHPRACPGAALLRLDGDALVPQSLRASLRSVGAFKEIGGQLFIGAMEAGEGGRYAAIIEAAPDEGDSPDAALGQTHVEARFCECALLNETVHSLARFPDREGGSIYGASSCELFEIVSDLPPGKRLVGSDPGGRDLVVCRPQSGRPFMARAVECDFSSNVSSWFSYAYLVTKDAFGQRTGPGLSALYNSVLWEWNGRVWGITDADPDLWALAKTGEEKKRATSFQSLCWFDGGGWHKIVRWPRSRYYLSRGGACGERMILFGRRESDRRPVCFRFDGEKLESNIELPYYVERADTVLSADGARQNLLLTCIKADPDAEDNTVLDGFFLVETTGQLDRKVLTFCCSSDLLDGTCASWCLPRATVDAVVDSSELLGCYAWSGACWTRTDCQSARLQNVWLEVEVTPLTVCFVRHGGPLPYASSLYECLEWSSDGDCVKPVPRCTDALCQWEQMPPGTRIYAARILAGAPILRFGVTDAMTNDGANIHRFYSCLWARADAPAPFPLETGDVPSSAMLAAMSQFQTRVRYGAPTTLSKPAQKHLDVLALIPGETDWDTLIQPL